MKPVRFIHLSDSHLGPNAQFTLHGSNPFERTKRCIETINALPFDIDFVVHTGDVVADPGRAEYALARELFTNLRFPVHFAVGNHDTSILVREFLGPLAKITLPDNGPTYTHAYSFTVNNISFVVLDARGPDSIDPHGDLPREQFTLLKGAAANSKAMVVMTHYPNTLCESTWVDRDMLLLNSDETHSCFRALGPALKAVLHGHIHSSLQIVRDGVLYSSVAGLLCQFDTWPELGDATFDCATAPGFNLVSVDENQIIIKNMWAKPNA